MTKLSCFVAVIVVSFLVLPGTLSGKMDGPLAQQSLKGLTGVNIFITPLTSYFKDTGLTESLIRTDIEVKLRLAGLKVLTEIERADAPGHPQLSIYLLALKQTNDKYVFYSRISLTEDAVLERTSERRHILPTWSADWLAYNADIQVIRQTIKDGVDHFLNAWLSVNPKK